VEAIKKKKKKRNGFSPNYDCSVELSMKFTFFTKFEHEKLHCLIAFSTIKLDSLSLSLSQRRYDCVFQAFIPQIFFKKKEGR